MTSNLGVVWLAGAPKPREYLEAAEERAVSVRKLLAAWQDERGSSGSSRSAANALALADQIEQLARLGRKSSAAEAKDIAASIELLVEALADEVHFLLVSRTQHVEG